MFKLAYQSGWVIGITTPEVREILPYLSYSMYLFQKLVPLGPDAVTMNNFLRHIDIGMRMSVIRPISRYVSNYYHAHVLRWASRMVIGPVPTPALSQMGVADFCIAVSQDAIEYFHPLTAVNIEKALTTLDHRLPNRGQTSGGMALTVRLLEYLSGNEDHNVILPAIIQNYPWNLFAPEIFPAVVDVSDWQNRLTTLLTWISTDRRKSKEFLQRTLAIRGVVHV